MLNIEYTLIRREEKFTVENINSGWNKLNIPL